MDWFAFVRKLTKKPPMTEATGGCKALHTKDSQIGNCLRR